MNKLGDIVTIDGYYNPIRVNELQEFVIKEVENNIPTKLIPVNPKEIIDYRKREWERKYG